MPSLYSRNVSEWLTTLDMLNCRPNTILRSLPLNQFTEYVFCATARFSPPRLHKWQAHVKQHPKINYPTISYNKVEQESKRGRGRGRGSGSGSGSGREGQTERQRQWGSKVQFCCLHRKEGRQAEKRGWCKPCGDYVALHGISEHLCGSSHKFLGIVTITGFPTHQFTPDLLEVSRDYQYFPWKSTHSHQWPKKN